jgi:hypothetical protein
MERTEIAHNRLPNNFVSLNMRTVVIDILNEKVVALLNDLEVLKLIRLRKQNATTNLANLQKYKGAMTKQPLNEIDEQLNLMRNSWE